MQHIEAWTKSHQYISISSDNGLAPNRQQAINEPMMIQIIEAYAYKQAPKS